MNMLSRLLLAIVGILLIIAGFFCVFLYLNVNIVDLSGSAFAGFSGKDEAGLAGLFLLLSGMIVIGVVIPGGSADKKASRRAIMVQNPNGEVGITYGAIENMALRVSREIDGIRDIEARVNETRQGTIIYLRIKVLSDLEIPRLSSALQDKVKEYVENITGITIREIRVSIDNIIEESVPPRPA
ncbi:MAG: alkaline shock response membrane anchor protein AmaP [Dethiobacteria bacterium]